MVLQSTVLNECSISEPENQDSGTAKQKNKADRPQEKDRTLHLY